MPLIGVLVDGGREYRILDDDHSGWCAIGRHDQCAHRPGGPHEHGVSHPVGGGPPAYTWRCGCPCHTTPETIGFLF